MEPVQTQKGLLKGVLILTVGAMITKVLSALYRIPFQNIAGDVAFYIYQQVYPFYGLAIVLTTSGFPVIISKLYAEKIAHQDRNGASKVLWVSLLYLSLVGLLVFSSMYSGAGWLAGKMHDSDLALLFRVISVIFLILPINAVLRGYFQGVGHMLPTASSQVGEQLIRVVTILFLTTLFIRKDYSEYVVGGGAAFGSITGGIVSVLVLGYFWKGERTGTNLNAFRSLKMKEFYGIVKVLTIQGFAVCITGMLLIFIQMADSINLYRLLVTTGFDQDTAKALKGIYDRGQPLLQLGTIVATSMSLSLVPLISTGKLKKDRRSLYEKIQTALKTSVLIGAGGAIGLAFIISPVNIMLFENNHGSNVLAILSILILICSVIITISSILQGLGKSILPATVILAGFLMKCLLNIPLVTNYGTMGAAIASVIAMLIVLSFLTVQLKRVVHKRLFPKGFLRTIMIACFLMGVSLFGYLKITEFLLPSTRLIASFQALSGVLFGGCLYLLIVLKQGALKESEVLLLPFGSKLLLFFPKRKGNENQ